MYKVGVGKREHACLGISPFNSHFSEPYIRVLFDWAGQNFKTFHVFIPDQPSIHTLEALGYSKEKAEKKAKKQNRYLRNKICRALNDGRNYDRPLGEIVLDFEVLSENPFYKKSYSEVLSAYDRDRDFRMECLAATDWVLNSKTGAAITDEQRAIAVKYLLAEIPVITRSREICSVPSSSFCYHQDVPFFRRLFGHKFCFKPSLSQEYYVIPDLMSDSVFSPGVYC